ncbi:prolipoprotein diacylglyceryl transferase [Rhodovulum adriaticum]|uniref:Phosphatidylglycerol--prolipoprotein diacylglyceryl transferase n=1 Tax=Rhodovulum adriaticum TaxID=35804 RepID=A0A4R2NXI5_RHOAD|nr:prolipoprotein diacylglyceryl transferase [Rhodovulum adriaticum]MBK1635253.1 prolipoprotein diacylglyceryl transferase [Rhodovulum adriaticum]TCP26388.1 prolipoprotein diacylglyceryl transferase [Rhodovulum adriaticum]
MQAVLHFPDISPEIFSISILGIEFALRWYALAYIAGILLGWRLIVSLVRTPRLWPAERAPMTPAQVEGLLTWIILGVILGGRLGFVFFYKPMHYLSHPWEIPMIWQGGMAFHGGLLGVMLALVLFTRKHSIPLLSASDALAVATPAGLLFGRIANFINAELWGRPSDVPWAVVFPGELAQYCPGWDQMPCARHPSQLYEAALEGLVLGVLVLWLAWRRGALKRPGLIAGVFFTGYGLARMFVELFRQADFQFITPDNPMGHVVQWHGLGLSMGQVLSLPMVILGLALLAIAALRRPA